MRDGPSRLISTAESSGESNDTAAAEWITVSQLAKIARSVSLSPRPSRVTSPAIVVTRPATVVKSTPCSVHCARSRSNASFLKISRSVRRAALVRWPSRTSNTSSQSGTDRSSRSTSAVPTNPVAPVMAIRFPASDSAITVDLSSTIVYQLVEMNAGGDVGASTRDRVLAASLDLFGARGVDAVSLDEIARTVGVRKQTVLYWFESKDALVDEVLGVAAAELVIVIDAALPRRSQRSARSDRCGRPGGVPSCGSPACAARVDSRGEPSRLGTGRAPDDRASSRSSTAPSCYLGAEMDAGRLRQGDPRLVAALGYATLTGIATEPEALRAVGWQPTPAGLRHLRDELRAFLRAALAPT